MKTEIDQLPLELCQTVISALRELPQNVQLFWARNEELLVEHLNKVIDFEPVTFPDSKPYFLPAVRATTRKVLWKKRLIDGASYDEFDRCVLKHQPPQPDCLIKSVHINITLQPNELFQELGIKSANDLASQAFSYSQICSILNHHKNEKKKNGVLFFEGYNFFPLMLPTGEVEFVGAFSKKPWLVHAGWRCYFGGKDPNFCKGKLLLRQAQ